MIEDGFRNWLKWSGASSEKAISTRVSALRKIEQNLGVFGSNSSTLDEAYVAGEFQALRQRLVEIREDADSGGQIYRSLMPESDNPSNRLRNWHSWLGRYGQFLENSADPLSDDQFETGMQALQEVFLERAEDFETFPYEFGTYWEVEKSYKYSTRGSSVFVAADTSITPEERGKAIYDELCQSKKQGMPLSWRTRAEILKAEKAQQNRFYQAIESLWGRDDEEAAVLTESAARELEALREDGLSSLRRGEVLNIVLSVLGTFRPNESCWFKSSLFDQASKLLFGRPLFPSDRFRIEEFEEFQLFLMRVQAKLEDWGWEPESFEDVQGFLWVALAKNWVPVEGVTEGINNSAVQCAMDECSALGPSDFMQHYGFSWQNVRYWAVRGPYFYPSKAIYGAAHKFSADGQALTHKNSNGTKARKALDALGFKIVEQEDVPANLPPDPKGKFADQIRQHAILEYMIPARLSAEAHVEIRVSDVNKALALNQAWPNICQALAGRKLQDMTGLSAPLQIGADMSSATVFRFHLSKEDFHMNTPRSATNLILYGPPGTGKTYETASEAVKLCDGTLPREREDLMRRYRELVSERRIAFVTFHQSFDYESFVEGLRPETEDAEGSAAGFRLVPRPGVFREICALADQARTREKAASSWTESDFSNRKFWKMGLGAIGSEDDVYDDAIASNYVALGWGGKIDWGHERFSSFEAIKAEWMKRHPDDQTPSNWTQTFPFRCEMKVGDIIIVPFGNSAFRAIGEVTGGYAYDPVAEGYYAHRRAVRWLLVLDEPLPLDTIVAGNFTMRTLYSLPAKRVNLPALSRLISGSESDQAPRSASDVDAEPDQFVLIIDEINRANVSKVFGELITLLEPDKRLGMPNALTVTLPYSKKRDFGIPANLHVIGTMNTADRSIALLDTALRRRFEFRELAPDTSIEAFKEAVLGTGVPLDAILQTINDRVEYLIDREHRIGHAFFIGCISHDDVETVMRDKIIPLLQEYFFEDWARIHAVLGSGFIGKRELQPPPGIDGEVADSWFVEPKFADDAFEQLLGSSTDSHAEILS